MEDKIFYQVLATGAIFFIYFIARFAIRRLIQARAKAFDFHLNRVVFVSRFINLLLTGAAITLAAITWDISFQGLAISFTSFFAIAGVAFFANWSVLSNITVSVVIYFYYPYKIGSRIRIIDGDNSITGVVKDLNIFTIKIENDQGELISYPNNLAVQKPIVHLSETEKLN